MVWTSRLAQKTGGARKEPGERGGSSPGKQNPPHLVLVRARRSLSQRGWPRFLGSHTQHPGFHSAQAVLIPFPHLTSARALQTPPEAPPNFSLCNAEDLCNWVPQVAPKPISFLSKSDLGKTLWCFLFPSHRAVFLFLKEFFFLKQSFHFFVFWFHQHLLFDTHLI